jgi:hypothetical protein
MLISQACSPNPWRSTELVNSAWPIGKDGEDIVLTLYTKGSEDSIRTLKTEQSVDRTAVRFMISYRRRNNEEVIHAILLM